MKKYLYYPTLVFLSWRLIILGFQVFIQPSYKITPDSLALWDRLFTSWTMYWDSGHYLGIAVSGYQFPQQAFFPLWPLLIKSFTMLGLSHQWVSYLLTFILGLANFILFYLLAKKLIDRQKAKWALIIFACYPATIFLHAGYSENLFLFLTMSSFLLFENKKYWLSAIMAGLTSASRIVGIAISVSFWFTKITFTKKLLMSLTGLFGLIAYMSYLYFNHGDFLFFIKGQQAWCEAAGRCQFTLPLMPLLQYGWLLLSGAITVNLLSFRFIDWFSSMVFLGSLFLVWKRLPTRYLIYSLVVLLMPLSSGTTTSMVRMTLIAFPIFLVSPYLLKNKKVIIGLALLLLLLELRFVALFTSRIWVA